jgi:hypothetical protein
MRPSDNSTAVPHSVLRRLIRPWEYRHPQAFAAVRFSAGGFQLGLGLVLLSLGRQAETDPERSKMYRLSACFLVSSALQFAGACLDMAAARSVPPRT